jgi:endonuclease/exonuclease/phosphatase family metal-dependent hydrolase
MFFAAAGATVVLAACSPPPEAPGPLAPFPPEGSLRVMSWNLLGAQGDDRVFSEHAGWVARVDQLAPHVVVLQEAQSDDVAAIVGRSEVGYRTASYEQWACDLKPEREGVAILVRADVTVSDGGGGHTGLACLDPSMRRVFVWADISLEGVGPLRVWGTHLTAGGGLAAQSRGAQLRELEQLIADADDADTGRWLLAGDLNLTPHEPEFRSLLGGSVRPLGPVLDVYAESSPDAADATLCPGVSADDTSGMAVLLADADLVRRCGYTAGWPKDDNWLACDVLSLCESWQQRRASTVRARIDYVLRSDASPYRATGAFVPNRMDPDWGAPGAEWYRLSDHLPVVVDLHTDG